MAVAASSSVALAQTSRSDRAASLAAVDKVLSAEAAARPAGSTTVGIVDHGELIWTKSYGFADMEKHVPATRRTVYRIGSITKQFTGLLLLQLAAQGKVSLEDPATKYVPALASVQGFGKAATPITLLSLATHRAGLAREPDDDRFLSGPIDSWESTLRDALPHTSLAFEPNGEAVYSNIGYAVLGLALENATHTPYSTLVERDVLAPLGMTSSGFRPDAEMLARLAKGYAVEHGVPDPAPSQRDLTEGRGYKIPNGGLFTTVDDLAKFVNFEMGYGPAGILPRDGLARNFARSYPMSGGGRYGVGYMSETYGPHTLVGHNGAVAGYTSSAFFDPQTQIGVICLSSADTGCDGTTLIQAFAALAPNWKDQALMIERAQAAQAGRVATQKPYPNGKPPFAASSSS